MCARSTRLLVPAVLGATVAVWAADPLLLAGQPPGKATEDRILGTWILNVAKSKYSPSPAPKSQRRSYETHPDGVKATIITMFADGTSTKVEYVADYDSLEYQVSGSAGSDTIRLKRISDDTAEATLSHAGTVIGLARRVISRDGRVMTITFEGKDSRGVLVKSVSVYEKE